ncbi:DivIVA domain-containing protein [Heliorestis convoluta]|uniref:DivIVA domain-containing protein n=1 Tax=Heliorestis convoluta TaxID=356322 RepID=A0A5Q2N287_9FIRM|nr:DivIVA domain-containing protein [Heliorestis convoluta]QGG47949.1 DivIVA domain-containing protein [Heliorestis convoluta]
MLTPLEIHQKEFKKSAWGYKAEEVDFFLDRIARAHEALYKENMILKEKIAQVEDNLCRYKKLEETLSTTLLLAQKTADEVKSSAQRESELMLKEAKHQAEIIITNAKDKQKELEQNFEHLKNQSRQFRLQFKAMLLSQLEALNEDEVAKKEIDEKNQKKVECKKESAHTYNDQDEMFSPALQVAIAKADFAAPVEGFTELGGSKINKAI